LSPRSGYGESVGAMCSGDVGPFLYPSYAHACQAIHYAGEEVQGLKLVHASAQDQVQVNQQMNANECK